ncbi:MAG: hypothetical protein IPK09_14855 [Candidatus Competibacteraceae bacterium]|nr:hypothetical protein [Candidatus Competibacteraceae bacterium]
MILLTFNSKDFNTYKITFIFGLGLIGRSIVSSLINPTVPLHKLEFPYSWIDFQAQKTHQKSIIKYLLKFKKSVDQSKINNVNFIWSAGVSAFSAKSEELHKELISFKNTIDFFEAIRTIFNKANFSFHLISSAGGLFEGQCNVNENNTPNPLRPYGLFKLEQENFLISKDLDSKVFIYRPSSVYGYSDLASSRLGLINVLIQHAVRYKVSTIYAAMHTLRDYVLVNDIGRFIANNISSPSLSHKIFVLATGRSSTILEIIRKIETIVGRKLYIRYIANDVNSANNSYSYKILPDGFNPTDIDTGIRKIYINSTGIKYTSQ